MQGTRRAVGVYGVVAIPVLTGAPLLREMDLGLRLEGSTVIGEYAKTVHCNIQCNIQCNYPS